MYIKEITYKTYDEEVVTEPFYFHLTEAEVFEWMAQNGDYTLDKVLHKIVKERNGKRIINFFKDLIMRSYGEKSLDGKQFIKNKELRDRFMQSEAYSVLFMELVNDADKGAEFFNGILPKALLEKIARTAQGGNVVPPSDPIKLVEG